MRRILEIPCGDWREHGGMADAADLKTAGINPTSAEHYTDPGPNCSMQPLVNLCRGGVESVLKARLHAR